HLLQPLKALEVRIGHGGAAVLKIDFQGVAPSYSLAHQPADSFDLLDDLAGLGRFSGRRCLRLRRLERCGHDQGREPAISRAHDSSSLIGRAVFSTSGMGRMPGAVNSWWMSMPRARHRVAMKSAALMGRSTTVAPGCLPAALVLPIT